MLRALLRLVLVIVVLGAIAAYFLGYRITDRGGAIAIERPTGTSGSGVDTTRARETGAEIGEKVAVGADQAQRALANAALTAKIKSKMTLDDTIEAGRIDVDTADGVVTLTGSVRSEAERTRAVQLARETDGVKTVTDRLVIR